MVSYEEASVKLITTQFNKIEFAAKNKTGTSLGITKKNFQIEKLSHDMFITTRETTKIRNASANNMSTDWKLCEAQKTNIIQSGGSLVSQFVI